MENKEELLTEAELRSIIMHVISSPGLRHPDAISIGTERTSIFKVSPLRGVIFVKGNAHTGFTHLNDRHFYYSEKYYWKNIDGKTVLDDPSKFRGDVMPITDYAKIADHLFYPEKRNIEKNKRPELFDMYSGDVEFLEDEIKYHMLVYKGTSVVHTLYPGKKIYNRKKIINLRRGGPKLERVLKPDSYTIIIPYLDEHDNVIFSLQVWKNLETRFERGLLINHKHRKMVTLFERQIEDMVAYYEDIKRMKYVDLSQVERLIKRFEKQYASR